MAMQAAFPAAALPGAQVVANAFVEQYYQILHQSPELVYKFYLDSSVLSRPNYNGVMTSVTTMQAINNKILSMEYRNYKAEIKTADAQDSYNGGVIVLVTGRLTGKDSVRKKFTQTFFLAPQENGYYVLNDVFRYVDESESLDVNFVLENGINGNTELAPSLLDPESIRGPHQPSLEPAATIGAEDLNGAEVCDPSDHEEGSVIEEEVIDDPLAHSISNEVDTVVSYDVAAPGEKKSYASIVKVAKVVARAKASTPVYVPTRSMRVAAANVDQQPLGSAKPSPELEDPAPRDSAPESTTAREEAEGHSIFVRNLPMNASVVLLEEEFKKFGLIKNGGIQVKSNKGFCFGFVEFESLDSMQAAIEASPVTIGGRQTAIEEKRTTNRVGSSWRGRYLSGRGGFRNDSFRGRGNFGGGRGYGRSEFRNPGEFSGRLKGPSVRVREGYQRVDQNGGGRGGRQGGVNKSVAVV